MELPNEIKSKVFLFLSHPCADMIRQLKHDMKNEDVRYVNVDDHIFTVKHEPDLLSFVEDWFEYHNMEKGERYERAEFIKKYELSDDSDDDY